MASRAAARRAVELLRAMFRAGVLGSDPEVFMAVCDLITFVEGETMPTELPGPMSPDGEARDLARSDAELDTPTEKRLAAHVRRLLSENAELRAIKIAAQETPKQWSTAQAPTLEAIAATARQITTAEENTKLREAIRDAGFEVMRTSGKWSIHDVSEKAKADDARTAEVIVKNIELEAALRDAMRGKPAFELLAADLARASGLPACATWQEHVAACVALRSQVEAFAERIADQSELLSRKAEGKAA